MNKSDSIKEIATALGVFQSTVPAIPMNGQAAIGKNGDRKYKYATLTDIIKTISDTLKSSGLSFTQLVNADLSVSTILMHTSGEWLSSTVKMQPVDFKGNENKSPQAAGIVITYSKRYALTAILGISGDEDIDGDIPEDEQPKTKKESTKTPALISQERYNKLLSEGSKADLELTLKLDGYVKMSNGNPVKNPFTLTEEQKIEINGNIVDMEMKEQNDSQRSNN